MDLKSIYHSVRRGLLGVFLGAQAASGASPGVALGIRTFETKGLKLSVFYPSAAPDRSVSYNGVGFQAAENGPISPGNGRLVVFSHGSGGCPWNMVDAAHSLVRAGFVVAAPWHDGDNCLDTSKLGLVSWKQRPLEMSLAVDMLATHPQFGPILKTDRVGAYGVSAGGLTALVLAGGVWSPAIMRAHCEAHLREDFEACTGGSWSLNGHWWDSITQGVALWRLRAYWASDERIAHTDARFSAVVSAVPMAAPFDMSSLTTPRAKLALVRAGQDEWLKPRYHVDRVLETCAECTLLVDWPQAGHASVLSPPASLDKLSGNYQRLLADPPGFERARLIPELNQALVSYFLAHLREEKQRIENAPHDP